jgi:ribosome-binding protein aMBF1 (putative translation factor)
MMATGWKNFRKTLNLSPEEEEIINLEKSVITAIVDAREQSGLTQKQLSELCGVQQPVIARIERAVHSPQINSIIKVLKPLGYKLAVIKEEAADY